MSYVLKLTILLDDIYRNKEFFEKVVGKLYDSYIGCEQTSSIFSVNIEFEECKNPLLFRGLKKSIAGMWKIDYCDNDVKKLDSKLLDNSSTSRIICETIYSNVEMKYREVKLESLEDD